MVIISVGRLGVSKVGRYDMEQVARRLPTALPDDVYAMTPFRFTLEREVVKT